MPLRRTPTTPKLRPLNDPFTGAPIVTAPTTGLAVPSPLDEPDRQAKARAARDSRGRVATSRLKSEQAKYATDASCAPLRRFRLTQPGGPLTVDELAEISGVSSSTIERIEKHDGHQAIDAVWNALAAALTDPSTGKPVRRDQLDRSYIHA